MPALCALPLMTRRPDFFVTPKAIALNWLFIINQYIKSVILILPVLLKRPIDSWLFKDGLTWQKYLNMGKCQ